MAVPRPKLNLHALELDSALDEAGFRHVASPIGARLGARRIGAGVYDAFSDHPIWPYHYHLGVEEWLYVISGAPVLRGPAGEQRLAPGDIVIFPSGHTGAHTLNGPGRFVIFATGQHDEPWMSVYPDSDKVSGPGGVFPRSSAVDYWHREGTAGPSEAAWIRREPHDAPAQPVVSAAAGATLSGERLEARVLEVGPGVEPEPYHYVFGRETWALVLAGTPTLRHPDGGDDLQAGDVVCFPDGPEGARQLLDRTGSTAHVLLLSTTGLPANTHYPDTGEWHMRNEAG